MSEIEGTVKILFLNPLRDRETDTGLLRTEASKAGPSNTVATAQMWPFKLNFKHLN